MVVALGILICRFCHEARRHGRRGKAGGFARFHACPPAPRSSRGRRGRRLVLHVHAAMGRRDRMSIPDPPGRLVGQVKSARPGNDHDAFCSPTPARANMRGARSRRLPRECCAGRGCCRRQPGAGDCPIIHRESCRGADRFEIDKAAQSRLRRLRWYRSAGSRMLYCSPTAWESPSPPRCGRSERRRI